MKSLKFFLFLFFFSSLCHGQSINCPNNSVYIHTGGQIIEQPLPLPAASTTVLTGLPPGANGLAIGPPFGFTAPNPTFWTVSGGTYWYYNGSAWVNTTHTPGNNAAVNIGGGGNCLYNLVGGTGQIYVYNGSGNGTLLTTVSGFSGGGPYDIGADQNDNFYLVKATTPNPALIVYNPAGMAICSYSLANLPAVVSGGGFAIINNLIAVYNSGFSLANINPVSPQITFTAQSAIVSPIDFANCVIPVPTGTVVTPLGSVLNCANNTLPLVAEVVPGGIGMMPGPSSSTLTSSSYTWSGPGIIAGQNTATITVNQAGIYTFSVYSSGCPAQRIVKSIMITNAGLALTPTITAPACFQGPTTLSVTANIAFNGAQWTGPGISGPASNFIASIILPGIYSVAVTNTLGCTGSATAHVQAPPVISAALSSNSICAQGSNGSVSSLTLTPSGGLSYSLITNPNFSFSLSGPWICFPVGAQPAIPSLASATIIGSNGVCSGSIVTGFFIVPNPTITITPSVSSVCNGFSKTFSVTGASTYNWFPGQGLSAFSGPTVTANTVNTTIYSAYGSSQGCNSATKNNTLTVLPIPTVFANPVNPTVCVGNQASLHATGTATSFTWHCSCGPSLVMSPNIIVNAFSPSTLTVTGSLNSCTSSATASISTVAPPSLSMLFSSTSVCAQPVNGSPNAIHVTPVGAVNYTLLSGANYNVTSAFGPGMTISPVGLPQSGITVVTATLLGSNGYCQVSAAQSFSVIPNPVINSTPATAIICPGESLLLSASGASTYSWSATGGGLNSYTGNNVVANPTITSVYSVVGESLGCRSMAQANIVNLSALPNVSIIAASPTLCAGSPVLLKAIGNAGSYYWLPANGLGASTGANVSVAPSASQIYTVIASLNSCSTSAVVSLSVIMSPTLEPSASAYTICSGASVHLYVNGANSYNWFPATGHHSTTGQNIIATPLSPTTFTVRGFNGICTGSATVFIKTISNPDMKIDAPYSQVCAGGFVPLKVSGAQKYNWYPVGGLSSATGPTVNASPAITTNYTIVGVNSDGTVSCAELVSYQVIVLPYAKAIVGSNKSVCTGDNVYLSVSGGNSYRWWPATGLSKTEGALVLAKPSVSTVYFVESSYNGICSATNSIVVMVHPKPVVYAGRDTVYNLDESMSIRATGTGALKWISGENVFCGDCPETQISPKMNSCYIVEAINEFGCKNQDEVCISITDDFYEYLPNSFTPNSDGLNDLFLVVGAGLTNVKMDIYDRWGEHLFSSKDQSTGWDGTYKGVDCKAGVYTYRISYKGLSGKNFEKAGTVSLIR